ncbi:hypothetical protein DPEC_G00098380 [Dallia pectoralis]|uniref:Uncharacterized protein n=1 Tax=Dallia pectoralis TaxID=75939 RepID=A0ACC2GVW2_DALPE|nr:hypothetical protein DPEC_G00098380 [Dallia pectoralis]
MHTRQDLGGQPFVFWKHLQDMPDVPDTATVTLQRTVQYWISERPFSRFVWRGPSCCHTHASFCSHRLRRQ